MSGVAEQPASNGRTPGAVVGCRRDSDGRWLMIRRSAHVIAPGKICFPGGTLEPQEAPEAAAVREVEEELGLRVDLVAKVWDFLHPERPLHLIGFLGRIRSGELRCAPREVAEALWLSPAEIAADPDVLPYTDRFVEALERATMPSPQGW